MDYLTLLSFMPNIDLTNYEGGREQAYVKHYLLEKYLSRWGYKIGSKWNPLVFVDGFAGPWGTKDEQFSDASFGIAVKALTDAVGGLWKERRRSVRGVCIFVEKKPKPFARLNAFAKTHSTDEVLIKALPGHFCENIPAINEYLGIVGPDPFKFVFLDQTGWAATPMAQLKPFVRERSCELLFNLMTSFLTRFVDLRDLAPSYDALYGRSGVIDRIRSLPKGTGEREELAVTEYCESLRRICNFRYVSRAVILHPLKETVLYYLIFATNSLHGIDVFKDAERKASHIQNDIRFDAHLRKKGQSALPGLFEAAPPQSRLTRTLTQRYRDMARFELRNTLLSEKSAKGSSYPALFGRTMSFPLVFPEDLIAWIKKLKPYVHIEFAKSNRRGNPRKPSPFEEDRIIVVDRDGVNELL